MPKAIVVASIACTKIVKDMHHEACIQAVIMYHAKYLDAKVKRATARTMTLTREQYMQVNI